MCIHDVGTAAVLAMAGGINDLYNVCMTLFDVGVETTTVPAQGPHQKSGRAHS